jgi:hypothetical protein
MPKVVLQFNGDIEGMEIINLGDGTDDADGDE